MVILIFNRQDDMGNNPNLMQQLLNVLPISGHSCVSRVDCGVLAHVIFHFSSGPDGQTDVIRTSGIETVKLKE